MPKRYISPIMNDKFRLRNIPYTIRNPRDLDRGLLKTVYCGLETIAYKGPQFWQQIPAKIKKSSSLVSFKQNIRLWKNPKCSCRVLKNIQWRIGSHMNKTCRANLLYYYYLLLLLISSFFFLSI